LDIIFHRREIVSLCFFIWQEEDPKKKKKEKKKEKRKSGLLVCTSVGRLFDLIFFFGF